MSTGLPPGCEITASFAAGARLRNEFFINRSTPEECKALFDHLAGQKENLEMLYGGTLSWERLDNRKGSRIAAYTDGEVTNIDQHDSYIDWFIDAGDRLRRALGSVSLSAPT